MNSMIQRTCVFVVIVAILAAMALPAAAKTTLRFALSVPDTPLKQVQGAKAFKNYVESNTNGDIEVKLLYSFAGEREMTEMVQQGTLEISVPADGAVAGFYKKIQVFSIPYIFPSSPVAWQFLNSPFAQNLAEDMRKTTGIRILAYAENGFRNFTNNVREIKTPEDMKGLKMRVMESPVYMRFVQALGAAATPISFSELVMSLQQGVVDGQENATQDIYENGMVDVQKFMSIDEHIFGTMFLIINDEFFRGLPEGQKRILADGAQVYTALANGLQQRSHAEYVEKIRAKGVKVHITTYEEKEMFKKLSQRPVQEYLVEQLGADLVNEFISAVDDATKKVYNW